jgi:hypothetical protein
MRMPLKLSAIDADAGRPAGRPDLFNSRLTARRCRRPTTRASTAGARLPACRGQRNTKSIRCFRTGVAGVGARTTPGIRPENARPGDEHRSGGGTLVTAEPAPQHKCSQPDREQQCQADIRGEDQQQDLGCLHRLIGLSADSRRLSADSGTTTQGVRGRIKPFALPILGGAVSLSRGPK